MSWSFDSFLRRYNPWSRAVDPRDDAIDPKARKRHFEVQRNELVILKDGIKTKFGELLLRVLVDNLHDIEVRQVWAVSDWNEFVALRERRKVAFELVEMIGASEQRMRDIERIIEDLKGQTRDDA